MGDFTNPLSRSDISRTVESGKVIFNRWGNISGEVKWLDQGDQVAGPELEAKPPKRLLRAPPTARILSKGPKNAPCGVCILGNYKQTFLHPCFRVEFVLWNSPRSLWKVKNYSAILWWFSNNLLKSLDLGVLILMSL